ncbi:MAG: NAD-binding protein [Candidatus Micrarchaeia archaeon]
MRIEGILLIAFFLFFVEVSLILLAGYPLETAVYETLISIFSLPSAIPQESFYLNPLVAIAIIVGGISSIFVFGFIIGATIELLQEVKITSKIGLKEHAIVCGYGTTGKYVTSFLKKAGIKYIIIEKDQAKVKELEDSGEKVIHGDATKKEILEKAEIQKAKYLISCLNDDAQTLFLVLLAKALNKKIYITAKVKSEAFKEVLIRSGASFVTRPETNAGKELAKKVLEFVRK